MIGFLETVLRRIHHRQDIAAEADGQRCDHRRKNGGQNDTVGHEFAHAALLPRAEALRHRNREARAHAHAKAQHEEVDRTGRAHASQGRHAQKTPHDHRVHQIVQLLKQHARQQRQRKSQDQLHRRAVGHILCHRIEFSFSRHSSKSAVLYHFCRSLQDARMHSNSPASLSKKLQSEPGARLDRNESKCYILLAT